MNRISSHTTSCYDRLKAYLSTLGSAAIAYSGGADSTLLLHAASEIHALRAMAFTVKSPLVPSSEVASAAKIALSARVEHRIIDIDPLLNNSVRENSMERCYHCKKTIFSGIIDAAAVYGITDILEGSHAGDMDDFRPGLRALRELGVKSPLYDAGFDRASIREMSRFLSLPTAEKEQGSCLATRIQYGTIVTSNLLEKVEYAEKVLFTLGFKSIRARIHSNILRIEVDETMLPLLVEPETRKIINRELMSLGFDYITLDMQGYRTGSMNVNKERYLNEQ